MLPMGFESYSVETLACGDECWEVRNISERLYIHDQAGAGLGIGIILAIFMRVLGGGSGSITRQVSCAFMDRAGMFGVHLLRVLATLAVLLTHGALQHLLENDVLIANISTCRRIMRQSGS
jgi:hypothetical protein